MKKIYNILAAFVALTVVFSCEKEIDTPTEEPIVPGTEEVTTPVEAEVITISATLSDVLTKVGFDPAYSVGKPTGMALTWASGDKLRVYDNADPTKYDDFTLDASCVGLKTGVFSGTISNIASASLYNVEVINGALDYNNQTQPSDGVTTDLKYFASATGISDYTNIEFTKFSSVLAITAKLPAGAAAGVKSVGITASEDIFNGSNEMTITLTEKGDAGNDDILHLFATLPQGNTAIPAGTTLLVHFNAPGTAHTVYTRLVEIPSAVTFTANKLNTININASQSDQHAGPTSCDGSNAAKAYLIADKYQLNSVAGLTKHGETKYFKMLDSVDMDGMTWSMINPKEGTDNSDNPDFDKSVNFDGNNKTISNLNSCMFYVFKGSICNLTLDHSNVTNRGAFAEYCQGSGNTITNVNVTNSKVNSSSSNVGGLIGQIKSGSGTTATISNCTVSNTNVTGVGVVGGVIGYANEKISMSGCNYTGGTVTASDRWCGGLIGSTGDFASVISDCHVTSATIASSSDRVGGCVGQIGQKGVTFKGCTVGTSLQKVTINSTLDANTINLGGFVGVCYGTVTKNGDVRSEAHVTITSSNTNASKYVKIGGFVGYLEKGTVEYSDAEATISGIKGHQVGGFAAVLTSGGTCTVDNCTANATVSGNNYVGGFIGQAEAADHIVSNNTSAGTVSGAATVAGFVGYAAQGSWTKNSTSCSVTASGANSGNFAGQLNGNVTVSQCFCTGSVTGNGNVCGGFTGIASNGATINDCYSTCTIGGGTRKRGGIAGYVDAGTVSINRCYTTCNISNNFEMGGIVGFVNVASFTMNDCAAWNSSITAANRTKTNWSSGAIIGVTHPNCHASNNFRNPDMTMNVYCVPDADFDQPDIDGTTTPLYWVSSDDTFTWSYCDQTSVSAGTSNCYAARWAYHGKHSSTNRLSTLASTAKGSGGLGWSSDVWDFTGDLPTLK